MKAHEIFRSLEGPQAAGILGYLRENERDIYRTTLATLASQRRLRPIFVQRKSGPEQAAWMQKTLALRSSDPVAEHLLQVWLLKGNRDMLVAFLDRLGVEHDGEGAVDDLPANLDGTAVREGVEDLLARFPRHAVAIYLNLFQLQTADGWPEVAELLRTDPRLSLGEPLAATGEESEATPAAEEGDQVPETSPTGDGSGAGASLSAEETPSESEK